MVLDTLIRQIYITKGVGDVFAFGAGVTKGYFNSQGIDAPGILDKGLVLGPLAIQAGAGAYSGLFEGISDEDNQNYLPFAIKGGVLGLGIGALEMGIGYCIGYTIGGLTK
ncbi:MAG: hypothetical protein WC867_03595 [Candidatus Pacearchaeota archaeon]|jgi:hypothetical protein